MKKHYLLLLLIIVILSIAGCSVVLRGSYPRAKTSRTDWLETKNDDGSYEFKYEDVSVRLLPYYNNTTRRMWQGPPLFPFLFPVFLFAPEDNSRNLILTIKIEIESPTYTPDFDVSKIQVQPSDGKIRRFIPRKPLVDDKTLYYGLDCGFSMPELERFTIDLGSLNVGGKSIKLPPLEFRKESRYSYLPLVITDHLEDAYDAFIGETNCQSD